MACLLILCLIFSLLPCALSINTIILGEDRNITEWFWQTSVVAGSQLYIAGGEYYNYTDGSGPFVYDVPQDIIVDLSQSWTNATIPSTLVSRGAIPSVRRPMLWYDEGTNKIYRYGGWPYAEDGTYSQSLWSLDMSDAASGGWSSTTSTGTTGLDNDSRAPGGSAYTFANSTFYALGGSTPDYQTALQGFLKYDDTTGAWTNDSSVGATSTGYWAMAAAAAAPGFGTAGYLVFVGGTSSESTPGVTTSTLLINLSLITLYDLDSGTWYQQSATGDIPSSRSAFCSVFASTADTFEIFIYGGSIDSTTDASNPNDTGFLNVYVLSLPAFRWFKSTESTSTRRANHHCTVIGNRQMISVGSTNPSGGGLGLTADPWNDGIGVFDMTALRWSDSYDATAAEYESPDVVKQYYSSNYTTPKWSNPTLAAVFGAQTSLSTEPTASAGGPSTSSRPSSSASLSVSGPNVGAIAGGVVGGVVLVAAIAIGAFCFRRRHRGKQRLANDDQNWVQGQTHPVDTKDQTLISLGPVQAPSEIGSYQPRAELPTHAPMRGSDKVQELAA